MLFFQWKNNSGKKCKDSDWACRQVNIVLDQMHLSIKNSFRDHKPLQCC